MTLDDAAPSHPSGGLAPNFGQRAAAGIALLAAGAVVAVVAASLARDPWMLPVGVLLVLVAVLAGFTALVHRGARRALGLTVAAGALAALVALLDLESVLRIALVIGFVAVAVAAARYAFGAVRPSSQPPRRWVGPAVHGVLLMNPRSGGGKVKRFDVENEARRRGITPIVLHPNDDLRTLAERAVAEGADVLGMAGGDGSQALIADVARRADVALVCVPAGTRNHFALDIGLDRDDVAGALDAFGEAFERRIDLASVDERIFVNNASLGVYATVVQSQTYRDAKVGTATRMLPDLLGPDAAGFDLRFDLPDGAHATTADLVLISNNVYRIDRLSGFGTRARLDEGTLGVVTLTVDRTSDLRALLAAEASGHLAHHRGFRQWAASEFVIDSDEQFINVGLDGEALRLQPPLHFSSLPAVLRIRTPPHAATAAPAASRPAGPLTAVTTLLRLLAGRSADLPPAEYRS